jgi:hypothetical protein
MLSKCPTLETFEALREQVGTRRNRYVVDIAETGGRVGMDPKATIRMIDKHSIGTTSGLS